MIQIKLKNHAMLQITDAEPGVVQDLYNYFSFDVPGAKYMPAYKSRRWDGKIHLLNKMNGEFNAGLLHELEDYCYKRNYNLRLESSEYGYPGVQNKLNHMELMRWIETLDLPFKPRDYQYEGFSHALERKRCVLLSPTGSGKSFLIYLLLRWYLDRHDSPVLLVVPTTSLVEQMYSDFRDYGYNVEDNCHLIYSGKDKDTDKKVVITTWQSIHKLHPTWFTKFGCIFGDECHGFKAKSLSSIMNKAINAEYRFGTTGTMDGTATHQMVLEGLFGPTHRVTTTAKLQKENTLAKLDIDIILLNYSDEEKQKVKNATYQEEIEYIVGYSARNRFIRNLACSLDGNTLVLFNLVEKHGKVLKELIENKLDDGRRLFYVSGETKTSDREHVRGIVEKQTNSIILASLGTFSTGINIRNIHNIIFASPSKSQIRVLQSIGRGLRVSDDGRTTKLYDIADDLRTNGKPNFTLRHSAERVKIYKKEEFPFKMNSVKI